MKLSLLNIKEKTSVFKVTGTKWKKNFENWFDRMQQCINFKGDYFEKQ